MTTTIRTHRPPLRTTSGAAAAALLVAVLAGCSSGGSKPSGDITGVQTATPATATPTATATQAAGAPEIKLPSGLTVDIQFKPSGDTTKEQVSAGLTYALRAYLEGAAGGNADTSAMQYAYTKLGDATMSQRITYVASRGQTITGTARYYQLTVEVKDATHAVAAYCNDESKLYAKERATGKVLTTTPSLNSYTDWTMGLELSDKGAWRVASAQGETGSTRCQNAS